MPDSNADISTVEAANRMIETWPTILAAIDGMVAQTVAQGWPEPLARQMIAGIIASSGRTAP